MKASDRPHKPMNAVAANHHPVDDRIGVSYNGVRAALDTGISLRAASFHGQDYGLMSCHKKNARTGDNANGLPRRIRLWEEENAPARSGVRF
jgi:hypothetical protein